MNTAALPELVEAVRSRDGFVLVGHIIPDGDCIGSLVAMHTVLTALGKRVVALLEDPLPPNYYFLPGAENIQFTFEQIPPEIYAFSTVIYLDCAEQNRVGETVLNEIAHIAFSINIDHHNTNDYFADLNYVEDKAANGEVLYEVIRALELEITPEIALALFTAMVMDTGNFSFSNVTANTFRVAGALIELGADHNRVRDAMYESKDPRDLHLLGVALSHLQYTSDRRLTWMSISLDEAKYFNAGDLHPEGIVNVGRTIKGAEAALIFREVEPGLIKVGFRSKGKIDVAVLAQGLGGGGHIHAAGVKLHGEMETVKDKVIAYVKEAMEIHDGLFEY